MSNPMVGTDNCHVCGARVKLIHGHVSVKTPRGLIYYSCGGEVEGKACSARVKLGEIDSNKILDAYEGAQAGEAKTETVKKVLDDVQAIDENGTRSKGDPGGAKSGSPGKPDKPETGAGFRPIFS